MKYVIISSLILYAQIICKFDFFIKLLIILKLSQHQWIVKVWNNCFILLFWRLLAAHSLLETGETGDSCEVIQIFHIHIVCEFRFFNKKLITFTLSLHQISIIWNYCCLLLLFSDFTIYTLYVEDLFHEKRFYFC